MCGWVSGEWAGGSAQARFRQSRVLMSVLGVPLDPRTRRQNWAPSVAGKKNAAACWKKRASTRIYTYTCIKTLAS